MEQQNNNIQNSIDVDIPSTLPIKQNTTLIIILSVLLLISISISGYFAYQTQTLVKELNEFKKLEQSTEVTTGSINSDNMENWKSYFNNEFDFELKIPSNLQIVEKPTTRIGDKISIYSSTNNPESCRGDCNIIDSSETRVINGVTTRHLKGWWGEIGGNIAQSYASYVIPMKSSYLIIQIQELPFDAKYIENRNIQPIDSKDLEQFNQIISTFKFTDLNTTADWKTYVNNEIGITLKYPDMWAEFNGNLSTKNNCNYLTLTSHFYNSSLSEFLSKEYNDPEYKNNMMPKITTIGGKEAQVFGSLGIGEVQNIYIKNGSRVISIRETASVPEGGDLGKYWETNCKNFDAQTDKILSTIKFAN